MRLTGCRKPVRRLWLQSMTPEAIREGFAGLRTAEEMVPLGDAAVCRSESDWLVGINATRAMTAFNSKGAGFQLTPVGRVQTPTLAILAERENRIREFKPREYFEVFADFVVASGTYRGRWFDGGFKKGGDEEARAERLWERQRAEEIAAKCDGGSGTIEEEKKPASQIAPQLYDLTSLQREANARFGLSARRTLQIAQALYEKHKVLTYPRTDSRYLPADYLANVQSVLGKLPAGGDLAAHARKALDAGWIRPNRRIFDSAKVSDHFAIIPTGTSPKTLDDFEAKVFDMVARRFVAAFYPAAQFEVTRRITRVHGEPFRSDGKVITDPGWMAVYGKLAEPADGEKTLCPVARDEAARTAAIEIRASLTKPPARFTEATLLSAMEGAGKLVDDEELREAMSQRGLGTPATRAQVIEGLLLDGYLLRQGRDLVVTQKGLSLVNLLRGIGIEALTSPEMTGEWEYKLKRMERGEIPRDHFMKDIREFTGDIVAKAKNFSGDTIEGQFSDLDSVCPKCGKSGFRETYRAYECRGCGLLIWKTMAGRELERNEVKEGPARRPADRAARGVPQQARAPVSRERCPRRRIQTDLRVRAALRIPGGKPRLHNAAGHPPDMSRLRQGLHPRCRQRLPLLELPRLQIPHGQNHLPARTPTRRGHQTPFRRKNRPHQALHLEKRKTLLRLPQNRGRPGHLRVRTEEDRQKIQGLTLREVTGSFCRPRARPESPRDRPAARPSGSRHRIRA